ncbi:hypothetical protein Patl1_35811 [Pistacia atlantica]|nr:hypothetical protein Patl1_35811 [Pistacia atlantica]
MASAKRRRIPYPRSSVANKGHFVVYTADKKSDGAITLSCDSTLLEYVISLVRGHMPQELENALCWYLAGEL